MNIWKSLDRMPANPPIASTQVDPGFETGREIAKLKDKAIAGMNETQRAVAMNRIDLVWDQLFPLEQHRILQLLVERVIVAPNELQVKLHPSGVENLARDVIRDPGRTRAAKAAEEAIG